MPLAGRSHRAVQPQIDNGCPSMSHVWPTTCKTRAAGRPENGAVDRSHHRGVDLFLQQRGAVIEQIGHGLDGRLFRRDSRLRVQAGSSPCPTRAQNGFDEATSTTRSAKLYSARVGFTCTCPPAVRWRSCTIVSSSAAQSLPSRPESTPAAGRRPGQLRSLERR